MCDGAKRKSARTGRRRRELQLKLYVAAAVCLMLAAFFVMEKKKPATETSAPAQPRTELTAEEPKRVEILADLQVTPSLTPEEEILTNAQEYPEEFITALRRNPEIADFVKAYPVKEPVAAGRISVAEKAEEVPLFLQWDQRWGYVPYGKNNVGISGCGPTCLSMVLYSLTGDKTLSPDFLAQRAMEEGYYVEGEGTSWLFLTGICGEYGVSVSQKDAMTFSEIEESLAAGKLIICSMKPGDFTDTGHFIVVRRIVDGELLINDPFSKANSNRRWEYETIIGQTKQFWVYGK